jgi:hypothetical protein
MCRVVVQDVSETAAGRLAADAMLGGTDFRRLFGGSER